jgi:hypothetical protein
MAVGIASMAQELEEVRKQAASMSEKIQRRQALISLLGRLNGVLEELRIHYKNNGGMQQHLDMVSTKTSALVFSADKEIFD